MIEVSRREYSITKNGTVSNRRLKRGSSKRSGPEPLKHGTRKEGGFRGFQVIAKVTERRVRQVHSMQAMLHDDGSGSPPRQNEK